jgi:methanogenic corrinoid protein MtbC1
MDNANLARYNMKAVSTMVGVLPGTIRAWERRYQMIEPIRNEAGHRLYSDEHVHTLKWLASKVKSGFTISQAVAILDHNHIIDTKPELKVDNRLNTMQANLTEALLQFDERTAQQIMNEAFSIYTMDKVLLDLLAPILVEIGLLWENGEITTAHEHFSTSILRSRIGSVMHAFPHNGLLPKVIAVCAPGEWHELGLLIFTLYMRRKGFEVIYLGSSIKKDDIQIVLKTVQPGFLFLSCTMQENISNTIELIQNLKDTFPNVQVGVGGYGFDSMPDDQKKVVEKNLVGQSMLDWDQWVEKNTYAF